MIISDDQIARAFEGTNFGKTIDGNIKAQKELVAKTVFKYLANYSGGHTIGMILLELGMVTRYNGPPVKKARRWAYHVIMGEI